MVLLLNVRRPNVDIIQRRFVLIDKLSWNLPQGYLLVSMIFNFAVRVLKTKN